MSQLLQFFILVPLAAYAQSLFVPRKKEWPLSVFAIGAIGLQLAGVVAFTAYWWMQGAPTLDAKEATLYKSPGFEFFIDFYFDKITAVFALTGALIAFLVALFSRFYLHREAGFKRFFSTLLLFWLGYNLVVFAGNFETLFVGWELLGITSFLLIAFYRDRYLPVKNGFKVLSFYRLGDVCLMLVMWMSHHLWHKNITFFEWSDTAAVQAQFSEHPGAALFIGLMIVVAAAVKSAQLPFSTWLPRAMEGPTTSSAVFYGALSVHIGAFLLLRTYAFWENSDLVTGLVAAIGLITSLVATSIARVQSTVKTQIAYASVAQIGLMFVEIAFGFHTLALIHFAGNALLRTYQLLVSPSVLSYLVHDMFFSFQPAKTAEAPSFVQRVKNALYVLGIKEWNFDFGLYRYVWSPFKWVGRRLNFAKGPGGIAAGAFLFVPGVAGTFFKDRLDAQMSAVLTLLLIVSAVLLVLKALADRGDARNAWATAFVSQLFTVLAAALNGGFDFYQIGFYLSGSGLAAIAGYWCLQKIKAIDNDINLNRYHGHSYEQPGLALVFLLSSLGLAGFPITPTFIGVDLLFTHVHADQLPFAILLALNFLFLELALLRIYTRVFLGQHKKNDHPIAFRSS
jgi:NADH-quinone oxidoreductase subunit L